MTPGWRQRSEWTPGRTAFITLNVEFPAAALQVAGHEQQAVWETAHIETLRPEANGRGWLITAVNVPEPMAFKAPWGASIAVPRNGEPLARRRIARWYVVNAG